MAISSYICPTGIKLADGTVLELAHSNALAKLPDGTDPPQYLENTIPTAGGVESGSRPYYNFAPATKEECNETRDWVFPLSNGYSIKMNRTGYTRGEMGFITFDGGLYKGSSIISPFVRFSGAAFDTSIGQIGRLGLVMSYDKANSKQYLYAGLYVHFIFANNAEQAYATYAGNNIYQYITDKNLKGLPGPYDDGGGTEEGGGGGTFEKIDDPLPVPNLPTVDLASNGLFTIYNPSLLGLKALGNFLWSDIFSEDSFKKLFSDPMEALISLAIIPGGDLQISQSKNKLMFGNVDTGINCDVVSSQWMELNCGFVSIPEFWGNYLDYNPYTKLRIYLPYVGEIDLNADDLIGPYYNDKDIQIGVVYHIDVITGACVAYVTRGEGSGEDARNDVFYTATGNVLMQIPVTANDFKGAYSAIIAIAGSAIAGGTAAAAIKGASAGSIKAGAAIAAASATVANVTSEKETIRHSGNMAGTAGIMGSQKPYIYIDRPSQAEPYKQGEYTGYPSLIQHDRIGQVSGYTILYGVRLSGIHATTAELAEIERFLLEGVIL